MNITIVSNVLLNYKNVLAKCVVNFGDINGTSNVNNKVNNIPLNLEFI